MRQFFTSAVALLSVMLLVACASSPWQSLPTTEPPAPESQSAPSTPRQAQPPTQISPSASWIEVDLAKQTVVLHESGWVIAEYLASTGVMSDPKYATPPGLYKVQSKEKGPIESVPGVFVSDIIMFDIPNGNGIHSRPMDANGNILDATLGQPATAGCVRVGESARVFEFAQIGMWVWIH
jgi:lipoprotein-anchoring transpeptidase ErfK/SrfK